MSCWCRYLNFGSLLHETLILGNTRSPISEKQCCENCTFLLELFCTCDLSWACANAQFVVGLECWEEKKALFSSYCVPSKEQLTQLLSSASEAMKKSQGAVHAGGCGLLISQLSAPMAHNGLQNCWSGMLSCWQLGASSEHHVLVALLVTLLFYHRKCPFHLHQEVASLLPGALLKLLRKWRCQTWKAWSWQTGRTSLSSKWIR